VFTLSGALPRRYYMYYHPVWAFMIGNILMTSLQMVVYAWLAVVSPINS
jgi:hypothetical protein